MKVLIFGLALFISTIALADECPSLAGTYQCEDAQNVTKVKEVVKDGVVYYKVTKYTYRADGSVTLERRNIDNVPTDLQSTAYCRESKLVAEESVSYVGAEAPFYSIQYKFSLDVFNDLQVEKTVTEDGVTKTTTTNCERL